MQQLAFGSFIPEKFRILSGSSLKIIAIITMLIDHTAAILLRQYPPAQTTLFTIGANGYSLYRICRDIGRVALPIFVFLLIEGAIHTHNRFQYGMNLFLFACISEIPWNYMHTNSMYCSKQNVFFTLFFGYLAICALEYFYDKPYLKLIIPVFLFFITYYFNADYGWKGYVFILIMYWLRTDRTAMAIAGSCWLFYEWKACFAFISINMYNGKRGFIKGKLSKYFFYLFYPLHITLLVLIKHAFF